MNSGLREWRWLFLALVAGALFFSFTGVSQVAITEMMSAHSTAESSPADYFELTNFGTNAVDLAGYSFTDADHKNGRQSLVPLAEVVRLGAGESIVFVRTNLDEGEFRTFWGSCLSSNVQVRPYAKPGFSSFGDALTIYDSQKNLVDSIEFLRAERPVSFVYDPKTGAFGVRSGPENGGCLSTLNDNLGSPGKTTGSVPLQILRQPSSVLQCRGLLAIFSVEAIGMPRPRYQWLLGGEPIPGAEQSSLVVSNVSPQVVGFYSVRVSNGLSNLVSSPAVLTLDTTPTAPLITSAPLSLTIVEGRTARFAIDVCANPAPTYQWFSNDTALLGETNRVLFVPNCPSSFSGRSFCVRVENQYGGTNSCGTLFVTNSSPIRITELQASPLPGCDGHNDWFEVSNFGNTDVPFLGYRFSDQFSLAEANIITRPVWLRAHESIILVKNSSVGSLFDWWGAAQLPPGLQVIPYSGFSLGSDGDTLYLWNDTAEDPNEYLDSIAYSGNSPGRTIDFEGLGGPQESVADSGGTIRAVECGDIGTPGWTRDSRPQLTGIEPGTNSVHLSWRAVPGANFQIESTERLGPGSSWVTAGRILATNFLGSFIDARTNQGPSRFYRALREVAP